MLANRGSESAGNFPEIVGRRVFRRRASDGKDNDRRFCAPAIVHVRPTFATRI